jgi:DNA repair exonuclease SbcCD nuclease subunit
MDVIKFIAWADTHHDKLGAKCITIEDTTTVESLIFDRAKEGGFDFTLFAGDRFLKREPNDETKVKADRVMESKVHNGGIPHFHLIGNHDWVDNTRRWHTAESLKAFNNVIVMDEATTHVFKNIRIHALPADFQFDKSCYSISPECFNLFVFHDAVNGCLLSDNSAQTYEGGLDISQIDLLCFNLVLAGDIHVRQDLPFRNTRGGYLGSVIQRTKADSNVQRGWTEYTVSRSSKTSEWVVDRKFQPIRNYFTRVSFAVDANTQAKNLQISADDIVDQLVEIRFSGEKNDVDRVADDSYWSSLVPRFGARRVDLLRAYSAQAYEEVIDMSDSVSVSHDIEKYLDAGYANLGFLSRDRIIAKVNKLHGGSYEDS